jgi:hypothetical protein
LPWSVDDGVFSRIKNTAFDPLALGGVAKTLDFGLIFK